VDYREPLALVEGACARVAGDVLDEDVARLAG
jgi:hypothetical protein